MEHLVPPVAVRRAVADARELVPPAVVVLVIPVLARDPDDLGHRVGQLAKPRLALAQRRLELQSFAEVVEVANHAGPRVRQGYPLNPPVVRFHIASALTSFDRAGRDVRLA